MTTEHMKGTTGAVTMIPVKRKADVQAASINDKTDQKQNKLLKSWKECLLESTNRNSGHYSNCQDCETEIHLNQLSRHMSKAHGKPLHCKKKGCYTFFKLRDEHEEHEASCKAGIEESSQQPVCYLSTSPATQLDRLPKQTKLIKFPLNGVLSHTSLNAADGITLVGVLAPYQVAPEEQQYLLQAPAQPALQPQLRDQVEGLIPQTYPLSEQEQILPINIENIVEQPSLQNNLIVEERQHSKLISNAQRGFSGQPDSTEEDTACPLSLSLQLQLGDASSAEVQSHVQAEQSLENELEGKNLTGNHHIITMQRAIKIPPNSAQISYEPQPKVIKPTFQRDITLNIAILDQYEERHISSDDIINRLDRIMEAIIGYDEYIRGKDIHSKECVRDQLRTLDKVTPLTELPEVLKEPKSSFGQRTGLLILLRSLFRVPPSSRLNEHLASKNNMLQLMPMSLIVCGCLTHLVQNDIMSSTHSWEAKHLEKAQMRIFEKLYGSETALKLLQYVYLQAINEDSFQQVLNIQADELASNFFDTLFPLSFWQPDSPNNRKQEHLKRLKKITLESLSLAAELKARTGNFTFHAPENGENFDPAAHHVVQELQWEVTCEDLPCTNIEMRKQKIGCTMMFGVKRTMPGGEREGQYAKARVVLMAPYAK